MAFHCSFDEPLPQKSLLFRLSYDRSCSHNSFAESWDGGGGRVEVKDRLLDFGTEIFEVDDLNCVCAGDASNPDDLGLVFD